MGLSPFFFGTDKNVLNKRADKLELLRIAEAVALEKSIDKELIISSMETGIAKAAKSKFGQDNEIKVLINRENGELLKIQKTQIQRLTLKMQLILTKQIKIKKLEMKFFNLCHHLTLEE